MLHPYILHVPLRGSQSELWDQPKHSTYKLDTQVVGGRSMAPPRRSYRQGLKRLGSANTVEMLAQVYVLPMHRFTSAGIEAMSGQNGTSTLFCFHEKVPALHTASAGLWAVTLAPYTSLHCPIFQPATDAETCLAMLC